jgi:hypothetical protein
MGNDICKNIYDVRLAFSMFKENLNSNTNENPILNWAKN